MEIKLKKTNIIKIGIKDEDGVETGEYLTFDLEDIELPLKLNECDKLHKENVKYIRNQLLIIDKKEDKKGKFLLSYKEEEKIKSLKEFYLKEEKALDLFIGVGGTEKLLNGRNPYYTMYDDINEMLEPIMPLLKTGFDDITNKIKDKYKKIEEKNVIE